MTNHTESPSVVTEAINLRDATMTEQKACGQSLLDQLEPATYSVTDIRDAMQDLLNSQKGVVPDSAARFYSTTMGAFSTVKVAEHINTI